MVEPVVTKKDKALAAAQKFLERGQHEKALAEFARVVQEDPKDTRTWLKMAEIYARRGAGDPARDIYLRCGEIYVEQGFLQKAVAVYKNVLKLSPGLPAGHLRLGDVYRELGLVSDALQQLELGAAALQRAGRAGEALPALRLIVELHPENVVSRIKLAESASHAGATDEAVREFTRAAEQLKAQGRSDEYVRVAERLLFHQPDNFAVARELAVVYIARGNPRLALAKLQGPLKAAPREPSNIELLARALEPLDGPKAISVWKELAQIHDEVGRNRERDAALQAALAVNPRDPDVLMLARRWSVSMAPSFGAVPLPPPRGPTVTPPSQLGGRGAGPVTVSGARPPPLPASVGPPRPPPSPGGGDLPTPPPSGSFSSTLTPRPDQDASRILSEAEVFVKYGLYERAVDHLRRIFERQPDHRAAREKLAAALAQLGRRAEAAAELATIAEGILALEPATAAAVAERALSLDPSCARAATLLGRAPIIISVDDDDPAANQLTPPPMQIEQLPGEGWAGGGAAGLDLDSELEQVDFFLEQGLPEEAGSLLDDLARRFRENRRIADKRRQIDRAIATQAELERTSPERLGAVPRDPSAEPAGEAGGAPVAVMARGEKADLSTHGDLGIAYKEMGLFDAAIAEFRQLTGDQAREVFALTMIGECMEAKGTLTDAVVRYKEALNCAAITQAETLVIYYQLGTVFERLGDRSEALYFFEKVAKRDARFQEVDLRIAALKPRTATHA